MLHYAIPVLHVTDARRAEAYYVQALGFRLGFAHRPDGVSDDPAYLGFERDGVWLHVSSFSGDGVAGSCVYIGVASVDALHAAWVARGVAIDSGPMDQTWGNRELYLRDPDGNSLRFIQPLAVEETPAQ